MKNIIYLIIGIVTSIASLVFVIVVDATVGLHTLYFNGDIDLFISSLVFGVGSVVVTDRRFALVVITEQWLRRNISNFGALSLVAAVCGLSLSSSGLGGLQSAYMVAFLVSFTVVVLTGLCIAYIKRHL